MKKKQEEVEEGGTWTGKATVDVEGVQGSNERVQIHDGGFGGGGEAYINEYK